MDEIMFMMKERFERVRDKFSNVSEEADKVVASASHNDILKLVLVFNGPVSVKEAEIFDEKKFIDLAF